LLLLNGVIYTTWGSHCDFRPYTGWIIGCDKNTLSQLTVLNVTPNGNEGSFWMSGTAPAADANGNIFALDANGTFDATLNAQGFPSQGDFGNAFLKIATTNQQLAVTDYFEMFNQSAENSTDDDLGSGGAVVLPDLTDSSGHTRHLAVGAGKDAKIYVVDRDSMGKFNPSTHNIYQEIQNSLAGGVFSMPAFFNNTVYYGAVEDSIKAFGISNAQLASTPASHTANAFPYPGATPSISASGTRNAILWAVENASAGIRWARPIRRRQQIHYVDGNQWEGLRRNDDRSRSIWTLALGQARRAILASQRWPRRTVRRAEVISHFAEQLRDQSLSESECRAVATSCLIRQSQMAEAEDSVIGTGAPEQVPS
jgi:hypothetical protein